MKNVTGKEAKERLNCLREKLFTDKIKRVLNNFWTENLDRIIAEDGRLNCFIEEILAVPSGIIEDMSPHLESCSPQIISQIFQRFNSANGYFQTIGDTRIDVEERDSDFLRKALCDIVRNPEAS
jgi:hypothetical protein